MVALRDLALALHVLGDRAWIGWPNRERCPPLSGQRVGLLLCYQQPDRQLGDMEHRHEQLGHDPGPCWPCPCAAVLVLLDSTPLARIASMVGSEREHRRSIGTVGNVAKNRRRA